MAGTPFTSGEWHVKDGREDEFIELWRDLAEWTLENVPGSSWARLLRTASDPSRFVSIGPWESRDAIEAWRALPGFQERLARIREVVESVDARVLESVVEMGSDAASA